MTEKEQKIKEEQLELLQEIFEKAMPAAPVFKSDHEGVPDDAIPYICTSDLFHYKYNIRVLPYDDFFSKDNFEKRENGEIIAHYDSLEDLVEDGWRLD